MNPQSPGVESRTDGLATVNITTFLMLVLEPTKGRILNGRVHFYRTRLPCYNNTMLMSASRRGERKGEEKGKEERRQETGERKGKEEMRRRDERRRKGRGEERRRGERKGENILNSPFK